MYFGSAFSHFSWLLSKRILFRSPEPRFPSFSSHFSSQDKATKNCDKSSVEGWIEVQMETHQEAFSQRTSRQTSVNHRILLMHRLGALICHYPSTGRLILIDLQFICKHSKSFEKLWLSNFGFNTLFMVSFHSEVAMQSIYVILLIFSRSTSINTTMSEAYEKLSNEKVLKMSEECLVLDRGWIQVKIDVCHTVLLQSTVQAWHANRHWTKPSKLQWSAQMAQFANYSILAI